MSMTVDSGCVSRMALASQDVLAAELGGDAHAQVAALLLVQARDKGTDVRMMRQCQRERIQQHHESQMQALRDKANREYQAARAGSFGPGWARHRRHRWTFWRLGIRAWPADSMRWWRRRSMRWRKRSSNSRSWGTSRWICRNWRKLRLIFSKICNRPKNRSTVPLRFTARDRGPDHGRNRSKAATARVFMLTGTIWPSR